MIRRSVLTLLTLVLVLVVGAAACGGGDDDSADPSADDTTADEAPSDEAPSDDTEAETEAGTENDEGSAGTTDDGAADDADVSTQLGVDREFTGEGSEAFCAEVVAMRDADQDAAGVDDAAFADAMMAITPPPEIAEEWTNLFTVQKAIAADPSGGALAAMSQEDLDAWAGHGNVVAAYLGDVCELAEGDG